jgi:hypothetical protein
MSRHAARDTLHIQMGLGRADNRHRQRPLFALGAVSGLVGATVLGAMAIGAIASADKKPPDPWAGLTDAERQYEVDRVYAQQAQFIRDFQSSGGDARSLPHEAAEGFGAGPESLVKAVQESSVIVIGTVRQTEFEPVEGQWLGRASVSLDISRTLKGEPAQVLILHQAGAPAPSAERGAVLQEIDVAPVLLPGDSVLLMLEQTDDGSLAPIAGSGIVYIVDAHAQPLPRNPFGSTLRDLPESAVTALYLAAMR